MISPANEVYEYKFKAQGDVLSEYHRGRDRVMFIMGPLGSGKTIETCQKVFRFMCQQEPNRENVRPSRWYAIRNTYSDLLTTTAKDWMDLFGDLGSYSEGSKKPPMHRLDFELEDGSTVEAELIFLALDRPDHVKKLRGAQGTGFWLNEVKELSKAVVDMADLRHGRYPSLATGGVKPTWHGMLGDTNAPDEDHWYYRLAEEDHPKGWKFYRQPGGLLKKGNDWVVNPKAENLNNLPANYYLSGKEGKEEDWIKVNLANEYGYVLDGKPVYPEYTDSIHCDQNIKPVPGIPIQRGWDFGLTPACIFSQLLPSGHWIVFDEMVAERAGADRFGDDVKDYSHRIYPDYVFEDTGDPSGDTPGDNNETSCFQILWAKDIEIEGGEQTLEIRLGSVRRPLNTLIDGKPQLRIHPRCKKLRRGFQGRYRYKRYMTTELRYHDKPDKNEYSHSHDGLQYTGTKLFGEALKSGPVKNKPKSVNSRLHGQHGWMSS